MGMDRYLRPWNTALSWILAHGLIPKVSPESLLAKWKESLSMSMAVKHLFWKKNISSYVYKLVLPLHWEILWCGWVKRGPVALWHPLRRGCYSDGALAAHRRKSLLPSRLLATKMLTLDGSLPLKPKTSLNGRRNVSGKRRLRHSPCPKKVYFGNCKPPYTAKTLRQMMLQLPCLLKLY